MPTHQEELTVQLKRCSARFIREKIQKTKDFLEEIFGRRDTVDVCTTRQQLRWGHLTQEAAAFVGTSPTDPHNVPQCRGREGILLPLQGLYLLIPKAPHSENWMVRESSTSTTLFTAKFYDLKKFPWGFPGGAVVKNPPANAGDTGLSPGPGRSHMPRSN